MSQFSQKQLNTETLIGFTAKRGTAWHYRPELQGGEPNHYEVAIPKEDVLRRLFNWEALSAQEQYVDQNGVLRTSDQQVIYRSDTGKRLYTHGPDYVIHQFTPWLIGNVEAATDDTDMGVASAGLLGEGKVAWVTFELPETLTHAEGVQSRPFITAGTSMDGSIATSYFTGNQLPVCDNTYTAAEASAEGILRVRHTKNSEFRIAEARDMLGIVYRTADAFDAEVKALTSQAVSDAQWADIVDRIAAPSAASTRAATSAEKRRDALNDLWHSDERVAPWAGSAWGVVQALNTFSQHLTGVRGTDRFGRNQKWLLTGDINEVDAASRRLVASL